MKHLTRKRALIALFTVGLVGLSTAAFAYWTGSGSGSGSAATGGTTGITVNQASSISGLYPGGPAQTLSGSFDNGNDSAIYVASVTASVTGTSNPACDASNFDIGGTAPVNAEVPTGNGKGAWSGLTVRMANKSTVNQDACKGVTVNIAYTSN